MLRTTSKKATARIRNYIMTNFDKDINTDYGEEFSGIDKDNFCDVCKCIVTIAKREKPFLRNKNIYMLLEDWFGGLPSLLHTLPLLGGYETREILAEWLEQTEAEQERYSDEEASEFALHLLSREIVKGATKA